MGISPESSLVGVIKELTIFRQCLVSEIQNLGKVITDALKSERCTVCSYCKCKQSNESTYGNVEISSSNNKSHCDRENTDKTPCIEEHVPVLSEVKQEYENRNNSFSGNNDVDCAAGLTVNVIVDNVDSPPADGDGLVGLSFDVGSEKNEFNFDQELACESRTTSTCPSFNNNRESSSNVKASSYSQINVQEGKVIQCQEDEEIFVANDGNFDQNFICKQELSQGVDEKNAFVIKDEILCSQPSVTTNHVDANNIIGFNTELFRDQYNDSNSLSEQQPISFTDSNVLSTNSMPSYTSLCSLGTGTKKRRNKSCGHKNLQRRSSGRHVSVYFCRKCDAAFVENYTLNEKNMFLCSKCGALFKNRKELKKHKIEKHLLSQFICSNCGSVFTNKKRLAMHIKKFHFSVEAKKI